MAISLRVIVLVINCTVLSIALGGPSAFAQFKPGVNLAKDKPVDQDKEAKKKEIDQQYRETLKTIPDQPQKKVDPWGNVRSSTPAPK